MMNRVRNSYTKANTKRKARRHRNLKPKEAAQTSADRVPKLTGRERSERQYKRAEKRKKEDEQKFSVYLVVRDMVRQGWNEMLALRTIYKKYKAKKGRRFETGFPMESFGAFLNAFKRFQRKEDKTIVKR